MHFEYIADAVSHGLMRVQLDAGVPVLAEPVTSAVGEDRRSVALMPWTEELAWSWEAA
jgi:6,7-dimethyl-8-ribityllumazine synthase